MKTRGMSGWLALGALALATLGPALRPALASNQQADGDKAASQASSVLEKETVLVASTEAASAAAPRVPAAKVTPPPSSSSGFRWTGFYVGVNVGGGWGNASTNINPLPTPATFVNLAPTTLNPNPSGMLGGVQTGLNLQHGRFVFGGEFDFSWSGMDGTAVLSPIVQNNGTPFPGTPFPAGNFVLTHQDTDWVSTVRPRLGVTLVPRLLVYGTGGLAFGHLNYVATTDFRPAGTESYPAAVLNKIKTGWVAGGGAEFAFWRRLTAKGEYLYYDLGTQPIIAFPVPPLPPFQIAYQWQTTARIARFGLNFKF